MGMGIEENEIVVAKIIAEESKRVRPLAIRVKEFNVRSLTKDEVEVSLERLKKRGVIKECFHLWGFFIKQRGRQYLTFQKTDEGHYPQFGDDGGQSGDEAEVYQIEFNVNQLNKYLESKRYSTSVTRLIERRGEDFCLNGETLHFVDKNSIHYKLFSILYGDDGDSKTLPYEYIDKELVRLGEARIMGQEKMLRRIKNAVNNGLYFRVDKRLRQYVKIKPRAGVMFSNPVR